MKIIEKLSKMNKEEQEEFLKQIQTPEGQKSANQFCYYLGTLLERSQKGELNNDEKQLMTFIWLDSMSYIATDKNLLKSFNDTFGGFGDITEVDVSNGEKTDITDRLEKSSDISGFKTVGNC